MSEKLIEEIKELESKYNLIAEDLINAIWILDATSLKYEYMTSSIEKLSGYTVDEFMQYLAPERFSADSVQKFKRLILQEKLKYERGEKNIWNLKLDMIHKDATIHPLEIRAKFVKERDKPLKIVGIFREITDQSRPHNTQNSLLEKLDELMEEKKQLEKEVKLLRELLPICSGCRRIRDENNKWWPLDAYVSKKTGADLTHTICPDCANVYYPN